MRLYDIPRLSKIYGLEPGGDKDGVIIFGHLDGMYSYCWVDGHEDRLVHLSVMTPLEAYEDGYKVADG